MRVLVTAGGTSEPVDGVRHLTNFSTGATAGVIARVFAERGAEVRLLHAEGARLSGVPGERETFVTFADLETALKNNLAEERWHAVIHLAAVGDYSVDAVEVDGRRAEEAGSGKIGSGHDLVIRLRPNPKLIDQLRAWSRNPDLVVVGFKLTNDPDPGTRAEQVQALLERNTADLVVHNDLHDIDGDRHLATIHDHTGVVARTDTKTGLAAELWRLLAEGTTR